MIDLMTRRTMLGGAAALAASPAGSPAALAAGGDEIVAIWPGDAPGRPARPPARTVDERSGNPSRPDRLVSGIDRPTLTVRRPASPNGAGVLILPGGGYTILAYDNEGEEQARWLNAIGVTAFILQYRLPGEGWANRSVVPLQDAQRAIRVIRRDAARHAVDPARLAVMGFSAGGHLAGSLATRHAERTYAPVDAADSLSARPALAGLIYPVVTMAGDFAHGGSRDALLGSGLGATMAERRAASVEMRVDADTPPLFLLHAADDAVVPIANSLALYAAALAMKRPAELHAFDSGGHGFGVRLPATNPTSAWPMLFTAFARSRGVLPPLAS